MDNGFPSVDNGFPGVLDTHRVTLKEGERAVAGAKPLVAYFSMEYGLDPNLRIYAGGLGVLAGDHFKAAADLGFPFVAVGILWREGYVRQIISEHGQQIDEFRPWPLPEWLQPTDVQVFVDIEGRPMAITAWRLQRGSAMLLLLDVVPGQNHPWERLTSRLYGGSVEMRVAQEMVLGIGGVRALTALGIHPDVYHLNEGHAVFAAFELIRRAMERGLPFRQAWERVRRSIVFTTHTPVQAGNPVYEHAILQRLGAYNGLARHDVVTLGGDPFSVTAAALRVSRRANAVSRLHGVTARRMWSELEGAAPITSITNGVHRPTWQHPEVWRAFEARRPLGPVRRALKQRLLDRVAELTGQRLAPQALLVGSARRATAYKRADLLFSDPSVIAPLLEAGRLAVVYSGKAHPQDTRGKELVARLVAWSRRFPEAVAFLPDYDLELARMMVQGCDVWLNQPIPPLEASGTSGMKAAMNGGLNLSVLDGWWAEACIDGENGWQFGDGYVGDDQDRHDAAHLYRVLVNDVLPTYHNGQGRWEAMMRSAIATTWWAFGAHRMVIEYWNLLYRQAQTEQVAGGAW